MVDAAELPTAHEVARQMQERTISLALARQKLTQADLVRATGLPRYTISRVARGETLASEDVALRIEKALKLQPGVLARATKESGRSTVPIGLHVKKLDDGREHVQLSMIMDTGSRMAIEAISNAGKEIDLRRLTAILRALTDERSSD